MTSGLIDGNTLDGVSSTTLYTLHNRAAFANGPDKVIEDPMALRVRDAIEYDWSKFEPRGRRGVARPHLRLRGECVPRLAAPRLRRRAGRGLQTAYWRLGRPDTTWYSVDLEPVMELRARVLPREDRIVPVAASAFDLTWADGIDPSRASSSPQRDC